MLKKFTLLSLLLFIALIFTSACGSGGSGNCDFFGYPNTTPETKLGKITLSKYSFTIGIGYTDNVIVYVDGVDKTKEAVFTIKSEQEEVVSKALIANVEKGLITALKVGKSKINVHVDNTEADVTFDVTVNNLPNLEVAKSEFSITLGDDTNGIESIIVTLNGQDKTSEATFNSSDESVAIVDENGNITFVGEGTAIITVHVDGANDVELKVNVYDPENHKINFNTSKNMYETEEGFVMYEGETGNITVIIKGKNRTDEGTYTSGDENVVTVDNVNIHGKIYALHEGKTSINIHVPNTEEDKVVNVIVKPKPELEVDYFDILFGNTEQIRVKLKGEDITEFCSFASDDNNIATVNSTGAVSVAGVGNTNLYASYDDGIIVHKLPIKVTTRKTVPNDQGVSSTILTDEEFERIKILLRDTGMIDNENAVEDIVQIDESDLDQIIITIDRADGQKVAVICYQNGTIKYIDTEEIQSGKITVNVSDSPKQTIAEEDENGNLEMVLTPGFYKDNELIASWEECDSWRKNWWLQSKGGYNLMSGHTNLLQANKLIVPEGVTAFYNERHDQVFWNCGPLIGGSLGSQLKTVILPNSLETMDIALPFLTYSGLKLENVNIRKDNQHFESIDGVIYNESITTLLLGPTNKTKIVIPDTVTRIGAKAFEFSQTRSFGPEGSGADIVLPNSLKVIGAQAFAQETNCVWIEFPSSVTTIEDYIVDNGAVTSRFKSIYMPQSLSGYGGNYFLRWGGTLYYESNGVTREQYRAIVAGY